MQLSGKELWHTKNARNLSTKLVHVICISKLDWLVSSTIARPDNQSLILFFVGRMHASSRETSANFIWRPITVTIPGRLCIVDSPETDLARRFHDPLACTRYSCNDYLAVFQFCHYFSIRRKRGGKDGNLIAKILNDLLIINAINKGYLVSQFSAPIFFYFLCRKFSFLIR